MRFFKTPSLRGAPIGKRPLTLVVTQGDPAGIGPEVAVRAALEFHASVSSSSDPGSDDASDVRTILLGAPEHLGGAWRLALAGGARRPTVATSESPSPDFLSFEDALAAPAGLHFADLGEPALNRLVEPGRGDAIGARAAIRAIETAIGAALAGRADAICTAPIHKENLRAAGFSHPGHTELLAERAGASLGGPPLPVAMMLACPRLRVVPLTIHEPLARVPSLVTRERILETLRVIHDALARPPATGPRIAVCGLNPHAGEGGAFGREEIETIAPSVRAAAVSGIDARGPFGADTLFHRAIEGEFDVVLAMYHDQGLVAIKTLDFHGGVNVTLGLPFVRTSPDHGTAYELAGTGRADPRSTLAAIRMAVEMARERRARGE